MKKDLLSLWDLSAAEIESLLNEARVLKGEAPSHLLSGRNLALVFEKASTRTKVSFTVAAHRLGANIVTLDHTSSQMGRGETYGDTARVLSQYVDAIVFRTYGQASIQEMAEFATVPVINGLSDMYHPCQVLADLLTIQEEKGRLQDQVIAWVGDGNNMCHSWIVAATQLGLRLQIATPPQREPNAELMTKVRTLNASISLTHNPHDAVQGAHVINTDTWESMGQEGQQEASEVFAGFQLDDALLDRAEAEAIVMHCLPAHRGEEITASVLDGPQSRVWQEAGNRLWVQEAILARYMKPGQV